MRTGSSDLDHCHVNRKKKKSPRLQSPTFIIIILETKWLVRRCFPKAAIRIVFRIVLAIQLRCVDENTGQSLTAEMELVCVRELEPARSSAEEDNWNAFVPLGAETSVIPAIVHYFVELSSFVYHLLFLLLLFSL